MSHAGLRHSVLTYVSDASTSNVYIYNTTGTQVGFINNALTGFRDPQGQCIDAGGHIFVAYYTSGFPVEYKNGDTTPFVIFGASGGDSIGCSSDPRGHALAVANWNGQFGGDIAIYDYSPFYNGETPQNTYFPPGGPSNPICNRLWPPGYDLNGNLYVECGDWNGPAASCGMASTSPLPIRLTP